MVDVVLTITRYSAAITSLLGIIALIVNISAQKRLSKGDFKDVIKNFTIFLLIAIIGVTSMTVYHFAEETVFVNVNEIAENLWYIFTFIAFLYSLYESWRIVGFGKKLKGAA